MITAPTPVLKHNLNILKDERVDCYSVITYTTVNEYLNMIENTFKNKGGLESQRDTLKTNTAKRIRNRMIEDLERGGLLPPIVLGVIFPEEKFDELQTLSENTFADLIKTVDPQEIFIIDGMQRTTALNEANKHKKIGDKKIRIEYWLSSNAHSLTYRMLVLNTGQIPWNFRRQIEVVFQATIKEIKKKIASIFILEIDDKQRRSKSGQFHAHNIIELFLVFGARKETVDLQHDLADEFTKLDVIESTSNRKFSEIFYEVLECLVKFDLAISKYQDNSLSGNFKCGKDLFSSQPACVGFVTAIAHYVLGRPGNDRPESEQNTRWANLKKQAESLINKIENMNLDELKIFLDFATLNTLISSSSKQKASKKSSYYEREFFVKAFQVLIEEKFEVNSLTACWRAY